jgi:hypothetical protein
VPALQVQSPEFKLQSCQKQTNKQTNKKEQGTKRMKYKISVRKGTNEEATLNKKK